MNIPLGRIGQPDEIGKAVLYFVSDDASWVTGAILDSGWWRINKINSHEFNTTPKLRKCYGR